jgi:hypothetical protein
MIRYKATQPNMTSYHALGKLSVTYRLGKIARPHPRAKALGYGLLVFTTKKAAVDFGYGLVLKVRVHRRHQMPLPRPLLVDVRLRDLQKQDHEPHSHEWLPGTEMYSELRVLEVL